jgi:signal transduction histidine kinase
VRVERDLQPDLPRVPMDARLLRQAILNLILNATQAMGGRGTLTVRAYAERGHAVLEIGDTGPGIPEDVRHRIFEPFFTTKATGRGLGLAVVKRIVDAHYGRVETRPGPQGGTVFAVRLPLRVASPLKPGISSAEDEP